MPTPVKPSSVIKLEGNKSKYSKSDIAKREKREAALRPPKGKVKPPEWLGEIGRQEWESIVGGLKQLDLVSDLDVTALALYCDAVEQYLVERKKGEANPRVMLQWHQAVHRYLGEFGLSPSSRLKLATKPEQGKSKTPFEQAFGDV